MSTFSTACKTIHVSPSSRELSCDSVGVIVSQSGCITHDQGQILGTELNLMEMTEGEYTHLQHIIQAHMEAQAADPDGSDARVHPTVFGLCSLTTLPATTKDDAGSTVVSPSPTTQAIDLSTSTEEQSLVSSLSGEKTPINCGEVPGSVLAKVKSEVNVTQSEPPANSSTSLLTRPHPSARVCLERRFNCTPGDIPRQQDAQSAVLSNFFSILQQSTEAQEAVIYPQMQKWMRSDRANPFELSNPYGGGMFNPIAGMCGQVFGQIPHMVEPNKHPSLLIPKNFSFSYRPERVGTKPQYISRTNQTEEPQLVKVERKNDAVAKPVVPIKHARARGPRKLKAANAAPDSEEAKVAGAGSNTRKRAPCMETSQSRERHNSKERDRRRRIRLCCDELNMLVPFCDSETDKATTLQWTTSFLKYIKEVYGDTFKEEFQNTFCGKTGLCLKPSSASSQTTIHQDMAETPSTSLAAEQ